MSDALLKNTFNKISPAYELVADVTIATATTQVDFSGLNFGKDDDLMFVSDIYNPTGTGSDYSLLSNANYTQTNYYRQYLIANGTSVTSGRINDGAFSLVNDGHKSFCISKIKLTNNGYVVHQSSTNQRYNEPSNYHLYDVYGTSTFTVASITSLRILGSVANSIGIGSRFQLYRLKAKKVADIIVSSATTQVDITGLSIDKDSEYMLVSDVNNTSASNSGLSIFANNNKTHTNYYRQQVSADGTAIGADRQNVNYSVVTIAGQKTLAISTIKLTNNGYFITQNNDSRSYGGSSIMLSKYYNTSTFTMTSITELNLEAPVANSIGAGSRFTLYKMK